MFIFFKPFHRIFRCAGIWLTLFSYTKSIKNTQRKQAHPILFPRKECIAVHCLASLPPTQQEDRKLCRGSAELSSIAADLLPGSNRLRASYTATLLLLGSNKIINFAHVSCYETIKYNENMRTPTIEWHLPCMVLYFIRTDRTFSYDFDCPE